MRFRSTTWAGCSWDKDKIAANSVRLSCCSEHAFPPAAGSNANASKYTQQRTPARPAHRDKRALLALDDAAARLSSRLQRIVHRACGHESPEAREGSLRNSSAAIRVLPLESAASQSREATFVVPVCLAREI